MHSQVWKIKLQKYSVCACTQLPLHLQFSHSVVSNSLQPHGLQHARPPCPSPTPGVYSNSCPSCWWCHPAVSSSVIPFSSCLQSFPASGSFQMSQFFAAGGQSIGVSASSSVLPMNIQDWLPLGWTSWSRKDHTSVPSESHTQLLYGSGFFGYPYLICIYDLT